MAISDDYSFGIAENGISALMILASKYDAKEDYLVYSILGETAPDQFGYTLPETQVFQYTGSNVFVLSNYVAGDNPTNATVEINGLRVNNSQYVIDADTNTLTVSATLNINDIVAITSYNQTLGQYFNSTYNIIGNTVANILTIDNVITPPSTVTSCTSSDGLTQLISCDSTAGFIPGQNIVFKGTAFGGIDVSGTVYYVHSVASSTTFKISLTPDGLPYNVLTGIGNLVATVGESPAVRVVTEIPHNLSENDLVTIDGVVGSYQLNNNTYYAKVIDATQIYLYFNPYDPSYAASNNPVVSVDGYISGGYIWENDTFSVSSVFDQYNVDRLWVTVGGKRIASSSLVLYADNSLGILSPVTPSDEVIITSTAPSSTPNEENYIINVNQLKQQTVYRANPDTRTWLVKALENTDQSIQVQDVSILVETDKTTTSVPNDYSTGDVFNISLDVDKNIISSITVYNDTQDTVIPSTDYTLEIIDLVPVIVITDSISANDAITVTVLLGDTVYINGEQIRFGSVNFQENILNNIRRGVNGTGTQTYIPVYSGVYSILSSNLLNPEEYNKTWNSNNYNLILGDPLQISRTAAAEFLNAR